ncbi:hypothetical protein BDV30DRAFT_154476 [Aspergillus minisclerotigenes]|uniref:Uncharacterized protein n=1 Tax=Aspergillus minisclerotigenes TaxID=656917 RepID=A0A5N6JI69_9EURO|nr:hypothetical protein BDV30DRAFT_154476 [Aspergillus minisclerotigenes]
MGVERNQDRSRQALIQKRKKETRLPKMGSINFEPHSCLCDSGGRSSRRNRGSLCASLGGGGAGSRGSRSSSGGRLSRLLGSGLVVGAVPGDVTSLGTLVADLASRAQGATIGGGAVTRDVALGKVKIHYSNQHSGLHVILTSLPQA